MEFVKSWHGAIESDPYWQFEDLLEEDPEFAKVVWDALIIQVLVQKGMEVR